MATSPQTETRTTLLNEMFVTSAVISVSDFKKLHNNEQGQKMKEINKALEGLKNFSQKQADSIVQTLIPQKIAVMDKLLLEMDNRSKKEQSNPYKINVEEGTNSATKEMTNFYKHSKYTNEEKLRMQSENKCNVVLVEMLQKVGDELNDALLITSDIKLSISLCVPEMQEGNNFGVDVQQAVLETLLYFEENVRKYNDSLSTYYIQRGKRITDIYKNPQISNFRNALTTFDLDQYVELRSICCDLREFYYQLYNLYTKNFDKLKQPRTTKNTSFF
ncbi:proteasome activator complex subunit 1 [Reticulomyxa filosa]|uniref:Proteasome activator complex subunit 1 n=1 Tax=Reticulomyxa filosa TaxID=46433 RepID=X6MYB0_RETFI|nr:proteasome activator complex subunit 1 [Reticulomyxa filosa]|eukprot:ETO18811.1 proteasome activator complex subunit 1 [Reticulomyxa filosa]